MSDLKLQRDQLVYVSRPLCYFGKVVKVLDNGRVEIKHFEGENYEKEVFSDVPADLIRDISDVGYKEPSKKDKKVKRSVFTKKSDQVKTPLIKKFVEEDMNSVLKDLL